LQAAVEKAANGLAEVKRKLFFVGWHNGVRDFWYQLKDANLKADEFGHKGDERRNFVEGTWWLSNKDL
jgi:hypothetical protein